MKDILEENTLRGAVIFKEIKYGVLLVTRTVKIINFCIVSQVMAGDTFIYSYQKNIKI